MILPDVRGLYRFYEELALRFAERGYAALAFDYFGRTAGVEKRDDDFEYMPHVQQTTPEGVQADVGACVAQLRAAGMQRRSSRSGSASADETRGSQQRRHDLDGAIGFYGRPAWQRRLTRPDAARRRDGVRSSPCRPATIPRSPSRTRATSTTRSTAAGVDHEVVIYDGAPHSFFDRKQEEFAAESEDAWNRVLAFVAVYS